MTPDEAADDLWDWSTTVWTRAEVERGLLKLQDRYHLNVNAVLWAIWTSRRGYRLTDEEIRSILDQVQNLAKYGISRLREVRRYLTSPKVGLTSGDLKTLRTHLLAAELFAERLMQAHLARTTAPFTRTELAVEAQDSIARMHFASLGTSLERPLLISQNRIGAESAETTFEDILRLTREEEERHGRS